MDNNGDGVTADRPFINGALLSRNAGQGSPLYDMDTSLQKAFNIGEKFHINLRAEAFNLFNHGNYFTRNATFGNTATPVAASARWSASAESQVGPSQIMQLSARLLFITDQLNSVRGTLRQQNPGRRTSVWGFCSRATGPFLVLDFES